MVNYATHMNIIQAFINFEIDFHVHLGCIRRVRYTSGRNGFRPVISYEGDCNPDNGELNSKTTGTVVTKFNAPVVAVSSPSYQSSKASYKIYPTHSQTYKVPLQTVVNPSSDSGTNPSRNEGATSYSPSNVGGYDYSAANLNGPSIVVAHTTPDQMHSSNPKPSQVDYSSHGHFAIGVAQSSLVVNTPAYIQSTNDHLHPSHVAVPEVAYQPAVPHIQTNVPLKDYTQVTSSFTVPVSHPEGPKSEPANTHATHVVVPEVTYVAAIPNQNNVPLKGYTEEHYTHPVPVSQPEVVKNEQNNPHSPHTTVAEVIYHPSVTHSPNNVPLQQYAEVHSTFTVPISKPEGPKADSDSPKLSYNNY